MFTLKNNDPVPLELTIFDADAQEVAKSLLGKVIQVRHDKLWLMARIIETEAYYKAEKGSHASLGYTESRRALFAPAGTIYMYYARGGDSLNFSCQGDGNAVLIKSAFPLAAQSADDPALWQMLKNNPQRNGQPRPLKNLCSGQTLLCSSLGLKVPEWNARQLDPERFRLVDDAYRPAGIIQTTRLGIPPGRDGQLPYRFIDHEFAPFCTKNPLTVRNWQINRDYTILTP